MTFLATYWWVFLIGTGFFTVLTIYLQFRNMRKMLTTGARLVGSAFPSNPLPPESQIFAEEELSADAIVNEATGFFARIRGVAIVGILATGCGILTAIGVIVVLIELCGNPA